MDKQILAGLNALAEIHSIHWCKPYKIWNEKLDENKGCIEFITFSPFISGQQNEDASITTHEI